VEAYRRFARHDAAAHAAEVAEVDRLARLLVDHLAVRADAIARAHQHRAQSGVIQREVATLLEAGLGFGQEVVITPEDGLVSRARPDFFYRLAPGRGVLAEVERGGTTTNNHDLKDLWKAHISPDAQHLFLVVPNANWNAANVRREKPFTNVTRRLATFFGDARREIDVLTAHVFGYGPAEVPWAEP
jgi:hypothetical protein